MIITILGDILNSVAILLFLLLGLSLLFLAIIFVVVIVNPHENGYVLIPLFFLLYPALPFIVPIILIAVVAKLLAHWIGSRESKFPRVTTRG